MEDLPLGRVSALVPEFAVKDLPLGRTLMMKMSKEWIQEAGQGRFFEKEVSGEVR